MKKDGTIKYMDVDNEDEDMYQCVLNTGVQAMCVNRPKKLLKMVVNLPPANPLAEELVEAGAVDVSALLPAATTVTPTKAAEWVQELLDN